MISKAERTRHHIIERAAPLFNRKGYAATSITDILKVTGLAKGGLYGNFESKDELAREALIYSFDQLQQAVRTKTRAVSSPREKLIAILDFYRNYSANPVIEGGCPLLNSAIDADGQWPMLKSLALKFMKESVASLTHILQKGIDGKEFNPRLNAREEAEMIFATIEGGIMMSRLSGSPKILNRILIRLKSVILNDFSI